MSAPSEGVGPVERLQAGLRLERLAGQLYRADREPECIAVLAVAQELMADDPHELAGEFAAAVLAGDRS